MEDVLGVTITARVVVTDIMRDTKRRHVIALFSPTPICDSALIIIKIRILGSRANEISSVCAVARDRLESR